MLVEDKLVYETIVITHFSHSEIFQALASLLFKLILVAKQSVYYNHCIIIITFCHNDYAMGGKVVLFADDIKFFSTQDTVSLAELSVRNLLSIASDLFNKNLLSLNRSKNQERVCSLSYSSVKL
jgi:hypothetical protein